MSRPICIAAFAGLSLLASLSWSQPKPPLKGLVSVDYLRAGTLVQQGKYDQAIPILQKLLASTPADLKARNLLGIALLSSGKRVEAVEQFQKALSYDAAFNPALRNLAVAEMELGRQKESAAHFEQLVKIVPNDPVGHLYLGEIAFNAHRYPDAITHYERTGGQQLKSPAVDLHYAQALIETGKPAAAQQAIERLPPGTPPGSHFDAGVLLGSAKIYAAAAHEFQLARNGYPDPYKAGFNQLLMLVDGGDGAVAVRVGEQLLSEGNKKPEVYNLLSRAYEIDGKTQQAYDSLRTATQLAPLEESNYLDLMGLCLMHQNWDLSLEIADIALSRIPQAFRVRLQRGAVLAMQGKMEDAEKEFQVAAKAAPQSDLPPVLIALVRIDTARYDEAAQGLRARRGSRDYRIHWLLGEALSRGGAEPGSDAEKEAVAELQQAVGLNPAAGPPHALLGKMLAKRGDSANAAVQLEAALKIDSEDMAAAYQLAMVYRNQGNTKRAEELAAKVGKARSAPEPGKLTQTNLVKIIREESK